LEVCCRSDDNTCFLPLPQVSILSKGNIHNQVGDLLISITEYML